MPQMPSFFGDRTETETSSALEPIEVVLDVPEDHDERANEEPVAAIDRDRLLAVRGEKETEQAQHDQHRHEHDKGIAGLDQQGQRRITPPALGGAADTPGKRH